MANVAYSAESSLENHLAHTSVYFCFALTSAASAYATTIDHFTYSYTLSGTTYNQTFDLIDGQKPDELIISTNPHSFLYQVTFRNVPVTLGSTFLEDIVFIDGGRLEFSIYGPGAPKPTYKGVAKLGHSIRQATQDGVSFRPDEYDFDQGEVDFGSAILLWDSTLTITQSTVPDPTPVAVTPEPSSLLLFVTGLAMLGVVQLKRLA